MTAHDTPTSGSGEEASLTREQAEAMVRRAIEEARPRISLRSRRRAAARLAGYATLTATTAPEEGAEAKEG